MKKFLAIALIFILAVSAGIFYLNKAVLPVKLKAFIVKSLEDATGKKVSLGTVQLNIFKGLILKDLIIRDERNAVINVKEAYCQFLILPVFSKQLMISRLIFESPDIYVERKSDGSINLVSLIRSGAAARVDFKTFIHRVSVRRANVIFHDETFDPVFAKTFKNLNAELYLSLPASLKYKISFEIPSTPAPSTVDITGRYVPAAKEVDAEADVKGFNVRDFAAYFDRSGLSVSDGLVDAKISVKYRGCDLSVKALPYIRRLSLSKGALSLKMDAAARADIGYDTKVKKLGYSGELNIAGMSVSGVESIGRIEKVKGLVKFTDAGLSADGLSAVALGMAMKAKVSLEDFKKPVLKIDTVSDTELGSFQEVLKDTYKVNIPADLSGKARLKMEIRYDLSAPERFFMKCALDILKGQVSLDKGKSILENVSGEAVLTDKQLTWDGISLSYKGTGYKTSGTVVNFDAPGVQMTLDSEDLSLEAAFALKGKSAGFSRLAGKYMASGFSLTGSVDASEEGRFDADMSGSVNMNLEDLKKAFPKLKDKFEKIKPKGYVKAEFALKGNLKDPGHCYLDAKMSSEVLSLYGLKLANSTMNYVQKDGVGDILFMRSFFYGGSMGATGRIDWISPGRPFRFTADVDGVKIEALKADTAHKDKDIAGTVRLSVSGEGVISDIGALSGSGRIDITDGRLWQLNLFRGLGVLVFNSDFNNIIFKECYADFVIENRAVYTNQLSLSSSLIDLYGPVEIGFDSSVKASIKAEIKEDSLGSGTKENIAYAISNYSIIGVSGTLKEPKYKIIPDMANIVESIASNF